MDYWLQTAVKHLLTDDKVADKEPCMVEKSTLGPQKQQLNLRYLLCLYDKPRGPSGLQLWGLSDQACFRVGFMQNSCQSFPKADSSHYNSGKKFAHSLFAFTRYLCFAGRRGDRRTVVVRLTAEWKIEWSKLLWAKFDQKFISLVQVVPATLLSQQSNTSDLIHGSLIHPFIEYGWEFMAGVEALKE